MVCTSNLLKVVSHTHTHTQLMQHGITCIGFRDVREKDRFLHQVDRIIKLQQDRSTRLRSRADSEPREPIKKPSELVMN